MPEITCIVCPLGCRINIETKDGSITSSGFGCRRGEVYARDEAVSPKRMVTGVVAVEGSNQLLPVKTANPIPKGLIFSAMEEIRNIKVGNGIKIGQVICKNLAGTGVALVATKNLS